MIRQLLSLAWTLALTATVLMAAVPQRSGEVLRSQVLRRRTRWTRAAFAVAGAPLLAGAVMSLPIGRAPNPLGMIAFVLLCVLAGVAVPVVRSIAARARAAEDAERRSAEARFGPTDVVLPQTHRGLSGQEPPPSRW